MTDWRFARNSLYY